MRKITVVVLSILMCFTLSLTAFAHSGRTDSSGGHKDNKNVSGLGSYHYHHGYSAHLHTNGICPYSASSESSTKTTTKQSAKKKDTTSLTNINAFINDTFIPSVNYNSLTYIIAEDLQSYGFDVVWNGNDRALKIKRNEGKTFKSISTSNSNESYEILSTDIKTYIYDDNKQSYTLVESYNIDGKTIIKFAEIGDSTWDSSSRSASVNV
ncbi:YHYH domain-containing protein [Anaerotignum propionicum]|uniref:YHYH domain-containing protein n=1 Tax=Anaerotignum propionicum TaxID=28446 RepID=UPI00289DBF25|nr:YHYH domain-containing protein [Anaerotignum propionicum]